MGHHLLRFRRQGSTAAQAASTMTTAMQGKQRIVVLGNTNGNNNGIMALSIFVFCSKIYPIPYSKTEK